MEIREVADAGDKAALCGAILHALTPWFANEEAIAGYAEQVRRLPLYAAFDGELPVGFLAIKPHNPHTAEICVMGVLPDYHHRGIGRALLSQAEAYCACGGQEYLTVKTLDCSARSEAYQKTRCFYRAMGFVPLEVFPLYWDAENPCLFLVKHLR